jgi:hypothetical protein
MSHASSWRDQDELTQPPGYFQVRKQARTAVPERVVEPSFHLFFDARNRVYLALAVCGLVALTAFFMPYFTVSTVATGVPTFLNIPLAQSSPLPTAGSDAANGFAVMWLILLVAVIVMTMTAILVLETDIARGTTPTAKVCAVIFLLGGLAGIAVLIAAVVKATNDVTQADQLLNVHSITRYHLILGIGLGFWATLLAMLAIAVLGGLNLRRAFW